MVVVMIMVIMVMMMAMMVVMVVMVMVMIVVIMIVIVVVAMPRAVIMVCAHRGPPSNGVRWGSRLSGSGREDFPGPSVPF